MTWQLQQDYKGKFELIKSVLDKENCRSVLDIGCNAGAITNLFGEAGYFAVGVDQNVDCNGKHKSACIGQYKMDLFAIEKLPKFDAILLLSVLHQIIKEGGTPYAQRFVYDLVVKSNVLMIEFAGINSKYGHRQQMFSDNSEDSIRIYVVNLFAEYDYDISYIGKTNHNSAAEPHRYLFKLSLE